MTIADALAQQTAARAQTKAQVERIVSQLWAGLSGINDSTQAEFVERVLPVILAGQRNTGAATAQYIASVLSQQIGSVVAPVVAEVVDLRPVPLEAVYARPFVAVYTALSKGVAPDLARNAGRDRLLRLVEDDLSLAHRHTARAGLLSSNRVTGARRVIRPELSPGGTCRLCISASKNVYKTDQLMPIHTRCNCDILALTDSGADPAARMNSSDLRSLPAGERTGVPIVVREHGELGPVLTREGDNFTGPDDLAEAA